MQRHQPSFIENDEGGDEENMINIIKHFDSLYQYYQRDHKNSKDGKGENGSDSSIHFN